MVRIAALAEEILYPLWDWRSESWVLDMRVDDSYLAACCRRTWETDRADESSHGGAPLEHALAEAELAAARYFSGDVPGARRGFQKALAVLEEPSPDSSGAGSTAARLRIGVGLVASLARGASQATLQSSTPEGVLQALPSDSGADEDLRFVLTYYQAACLYRIGLIHLAGEAMRSSRALSTGRPAALQFALDNLDAVVSLSNGNPVGAEALRRWQNTENLQDDLSDAVLHLNLGNAAAQMGNLDEAVGEYQVALDATSRSPRLAREHADAALNLAVLESSARTPEDVVTEFYRVLEQFPAESELQAAHIKRHLGEAYFRQDKVDLARRAYTDASRQYVGIGRVDAAAEADHAAGLQLERHGQMEEALDMLVPAALVADIRRYALTGSEARTLWRESAGTAAMADAMRLADEAGENTLLADLIVWVRTAGELDLLGDRPTGSETVGKPWWPSTANTVLRPGPWIVSSSPSALDKYIATACERYLLHWSDFHQGDAITLEPTPHPRMPVGAASRTQNITLVNRTRQHVRFRSKDTQPVDLGEPGKPVEIPPSIGEPYFIEHAGRLVSVSTVRFNTEKSASALPEIREGTWYVVPLPVAQMYPERQDFVYPLNVDFEAGRAEGLGRIADGSV